MNIEQGIKKTALRTVIYGPEGIGKTTLASKFPDPLFIDLENGSNQLDVMRYGDEVVSFEELIGIVDELLRDASICRTLVIDTADAAEILCTESLLNKYGKTGIEEFGYGKGYTYLMEDFNRLLKKLTELSKRGIHVVLLSHSQLKKFEQPDELGAYDRYELKLTKKIAPLVKEWCDMLLFVNYKTIVERTQDNKFKASGGKRVIYTSHTPSWDAKNRFELKEELPLSYEAIKHIIIDEMKLEKASEFEDMSLLEEDLPFTFGEEEPTFDGPDFTEIKESPKPKELTPYEKLRNLLVSELIDEEKVILVFKKKNIKPVIKPKIGEELRLENFDEAVIRDKVLPYWESFKKLIKTV